MKNKIMRFQVALLITTILFIGLTSVVSANSAPLTTQLCMVIDGSGSISSDSWTIIVQGVADAIRNNLPHDGSVELAVVQFAGDLLENASIEVAPTVIVDDSVAETVASQVEAMTQGGGLTPMAHGLYLGWKIIKGSPNFSPDLKQIINLATDGVPNVRNHNATSDLDGDLDTDEYDDVIQVVNDAVSEGLDELDIEGIAIKDSDREWFQNYVVRPQPGHLAPPYIPGWIRVVANATEFSDAIGEKFTVIFESPPPTTTPVGGFVVQNKFNVIPWIGLVSLITSTVISAIYLKNIKNRKRQ